MILGKYLTVVLFLLSIICIFYSCSKEISSTQPDETYTGKIIIDSNPRGALIFLDGLNTSLVTPDSILNLAPASYNVKLKYEPFLDTTFVVTLDYNQTKNVFFDFYLDARNNCSIICLSDPENALIYLNDSSTTLYTPHTFEMLSPGNYEVKYTYPEHRADSLTFTLDANETGTADLTLQDTTIWVDYHINNSDFPCKNTTCVIVDRNNIRWVGTVASGIVKYDGVTFTQYLTANSNLPSNTIRCLYEDNQGKLWAGTSVGLASFDGTTWQSYTTRNSDIPYDYIDTIINNHQGNLLCAGYNFFDADESVMKFDGINWTTYDVGLHVTELALSQDGGLWIGAISKLYYFNPNEPISHDNPVMIDSSFICSIESLATDENNNLWIVAYPSNYTHRGIFVYDGITIQKINTPSEYVMNIHISKNNNKWVSLSSGSPSVEYDFPYGGLIKLDPLNLVTFSNMDNSGLTCNTIIASATQSNGDVWIATKHGGLIKYKGGDL